MEKQDLTKVNDVDDYHRSIEAINFANYLVKFLSEKIPSGETDQKSIIAKNVEHTIGFCLEKVEEPTFTLVKARFLLAACRMGVHLTSYVSKDCILRVCNTIHDKMSSYLKEYDPFSPDTDPVMESVMMNIMSDYFYLINSNELPEGALRHSNEMIMKVHECGMQWLDEYLVTGWSTVPLQVQLRRLRDLVNYGESHEVFRDHSVVRRILPVVEERMLKDTEHNIENFTLYMNILALLDQTDESSSCKPIIRIAE